MDIIVTTPDSQVEQARAEARHAQEHGGFYFHRFQRRPNVVYGERVFFIEAGYVRGFALAFWLQEHRKAPGYICEVSHIAHGPGFYILMAAESWKWIKPLPMKGFSGSRSFTQRFEIVGDWRAPKPEEKECS